MTKCNAARDTDYHFTTAMVERKGAVAKCNAASDINYTFTTLMGVGEASVTKVRQQLSGTDWCFFMAERVSKCLTDSPQRSKRHSQPARETASQPDSDRQIASQTQTDS